MRTRSAVVPSLILSLVWTGAAVAAAPAHAAPGATINIIAAAPVPPDGKVRVATKVSTVGKVVVTRKYFTVWNASGKKILKKAKSAWLAAGSYAVKTTVTYKAKKRSGGYYRARTITRTQALVVEVSTVNCATTADAGRVKTGDTKKIVSGKLYSPGSLDSVAGNHEHWRYTLCDSTTQWVWVSYNQGKVTDVWVE
jgi:hypothetical protein